ncbi:hypothetical protein [Phytohabitans houttuyneae]|uniref:Uncharacterized protein n=1 Tax=Phytohabitans houttuyneae TaxID=1076126 RepID=A0A6V8JZ75_9ACTN|nr:hypothetical protein [Phytohabitans houttuyneae]GFJ78103.1 hypothetical protein Phou_022830 [Phytohabitans houttuyneae]
MTAQQGLAPPSDPEQPAEQLRRRATWAVPGPTSDPEWPAGRGVTGDPEWPAGGAETGDLERLASWAETGDPEWRTRLRAAVERTVRQRAARTEHRRALGVRRAAGMQARQATRLGRINDQLR